MGGARIIPAMGEVGSTTGALLYHREATMVTTMTSLDSAPTAMIKVTEVKDLGGVDMVRGTTIAIMTMSVQDKKSAATMRARRNVHTQCCSSYWRNGIKLELELIIWKGLLFRFF